MVLNVPVRPVAAGLLLGLVLNVSRSYAAEDLLPDIIPLTDVVGAVQIDQVTIPGRKLLRLSAATPNIGRGRLEICAGAAISDTQQEVVQRVYRDDGTFWDRSAGTSTFHPSHHHVHFDNWAVYRLRTVAPAGGAGEVVAEGAKTSFCLADLVVYDATNPFIEFDGTYLACEFTVQGITPGWMDIYERDLPDQWIDITGVPDGSYWLETEVDPLNRIVEQDETNNLARFKIVIGPPPPVLPDPYEENDTTAEVDARSPGMPYSPNLGPVNIRLVLEGLSMDDGGDYFKFRLSQSQTSGGFVRIESPHIGGDLDLYVLDANGALLGYSDSDGNFEQVALTGLTAGDYYVWVAPFDGRNPEYRLIIDPSGRVAPSIEITAPAVPGAWVERGADTLAVTWKVSDPEGRTTTVSLSVDRDQTLDKGTHALQGYQKLGGDVGVTNVNTAGLDLGTWYLHAEATNGGGAGGAWAPAAFVVYEKGDVNFDGVVDITDLNLVRGQRPCAYPPGWEHILDMDRDGDVDRADLRLLWSTAVPGNRKNSDAVSLLSRKRHRWFVHR